jgi:hypothetical protein
MNSAVEWLIDESMKLVVQYMQGTLNEDTLDGVIYEIGTKAKEMEKQQIIKAVYDSMGTNFDPNMGRAELYYNETYKPE